jgi:hypothetical protein
VFFPHRNPFLRLPPAMPMTIFLPNSSVNLAGHLFSSEEVRERVMQQPRFYLPTAPLKHCATVASAFLFFSFFFFGGIPCQKSIHVSEMQSTNPIRAGWIFSKKPFHDPLAPPSAFSHSSQTSPPLYSQPQPSLFPPTKTSTGTTSSYGSKIGFALCFLVTLCSTASEREGQIRRYPISRSML